MKIAVLNESDARRIAAGEVVERPSSALRELLDNALDAGAAEVSASLEAGGIKSLRVFDNGEGMDRSDLELCILPHATSKIRSIEDLDRSYALGFRGEALASLAACSFLEIASKTKDSDGLKLTARESKLLSLEPAACEGGTSVAVSSLFYNLPARKRFLKSAGAETRDCQNVFFEKALAFPQTAFKLYIDGILKYHFLPADLKGRALQIFSRELGDNPLELRAEASLEADGFEIEIIAAPPHIFRQDKRYIQSYVNGRRIIEFALVQAALYAYGDLLPGGQFPVVFMFVKQRPDLIDFNIHPAKREAKFRNLPVLHKAIVETLKAALKPMKSPAAPVFKPLMRELQLFGWQREEQLELQEKPKVYRVSSYQGPPRSLAEAFARQKAEESLPQEAQPAGPSSAHSIKLADERPLPHAVKKNPLVRHYLGQLFGVFLLVEEGSSFYLIDQHAAHERILFNLYSSRPPASQRLLTPIELDLTADERAQIMLAKDELKQSGIVVEAQSSTSVHILAAPDAMDADFWQDFVKQLGGSVKKELFAVLACRAAVKEGEYLDDNAARQLIDDVFKLPEPFCPHGRPLWAELTRDDLYRWVKRII